ncbi:copper homeostasis protein CutC [Sphingomonas sp. Leaf17]|uniref:copper homeostasis protein CutC n=1 Tax=Sphingomonas sp. Leaf17 TaxID=1735683 RepID=UPI000AF4C872|nr:copper homeostasis protein CutC [Sphingomonas sp. Leaf17]
MLEICVDDHAGLDAAIAGGADRIELCGALAIGGITPSAGLIAAAAAVSIPVHALLRPRGGDFVHDAQEEAILAADLDQVATAGLAGIVIGATTAGGALDEALLARLIARARGWNDRRATPLSITLHRAFDRCVDQPAALETAIALGFDRILTSGGAVTALAGRDRIAALVGQAGGRIGILPGSGVNADTAPAILTTGVSELHASCGVPVAQDPALVAMGFSPAEARRTDAAAVAALKAILVEPARKLRLSKTNS